MIHGLHEVGFHPPYDLAHGLQVAVEGVSGGLAGVTGWFSYAAASALFGLMLGGVIVFILHKVLKLGHPGGAH